MTDEPSYEELDPPRPSRLPVRILLVVLVLGAATVGIVRIAGSAPATKSAAGVHTVAASSHSFTMPPAEPPSVDPPAVVPPIAALHYRAPRVCPRASDGQNACSTYKSVSVEFLRAVRARYPTLVTGSAVTELLRPSAPEVRAGLWSVEFVGIADELRLRIAISRAEPTDRTIAGSTYGVNPRTFRASAFIRTVRGRYTLQLETAGPGSPDVQFAKLARMAADRRLLRSPAATMNR